METNDLKRVFESLSLIGLDNELRSDFVELCLIVESQLNSGETNIRDEVTGPLVDALHAKVGILEKKLSCGTVFRFRYLSKIARDFIMSRPATPNHVWEPQTTKLLKYLARFSANALIGGAYFGDHAVLLAKQMAPRGGNCHAFEPNPTSYEMLVTNSDLNRLTNLSINCLGLWDSPTRHRFVGDDALAGSEVVDDSSLDQTFLCTTIDGYLFDQAIEQVDLIMLDMEGAEYPALKGAVGQLNRPLGKAPNVVFEIHRSYIDWSDGLKNTQIVKFFESMNYHLFAVRDFQGNHDMGTRPIELVYPETAYLEGPPHGFNMLAVKDLTLLQNVLFRFCSNVSPKLLLHRDPHLHYYPCDDLSSDK